MREGHTQCSQPADPTDPGDAADLGIPQGLEIGLDVARALNLRGIPTANTIRDRASSNSLVSKSPRNSSSTLRGMVTMGGRCAAILEGLAIWRGVLEP
jgi:hypothetical protein